MEIFISICRDHHIDEIVNVFTTKDAAVDFCKHFVEGEDDFEEQELTDSMVKNGWVYFGLYGTEGDGVRVEQNVLDPIIP